MTLSFGYRGFRIAHDGSVWTATRLFNRDEYELENCTSKEHAMLLVDGLVAEWVAEAQETEPDGLPASQE